MGDVSDSKTFRWPHPAEDWLISEAERWRFAIIVPGHEGALLSLGVVYVDASNNRQLRPLTRDQLPLLIRLHRQGRLRFSDGEIEAQLRYAHLI